MRFVSIGDLSGSFRLRYLNANLNRMASNLGSELASGRSQDVAKKLNGAVDQLGSLERSIRMISAYATIAQELESRGAALQNSLQNVTAVAQNTGERMLLAANSSTPTATRTAANLALEGLSSIIGSLNTHVAGQSLFAGQNTDGPALKSATQILDDLETIVAGETDTNQIRALVGDYFHATGGGFETSAFLGTQQSPQKVHISKTDKAGFDVTAAEPALRDTMEGLAIAALLTRGVLDADPAGRSDILSFAGEKLLTAKLGVVTIQAEIGGMEDRIARVQVANAAQQTGLKLMRNDMTLVDSYETASGMQAVEAQLEALYIATSRLSQLSLTKYIR